MFNYKEYHPFFEHIDEPATNCPYQVEKFENFEDLKVQEKKQQELEKTNEEATKVIQNAEEKKQELSQKIVEKKRVIKTKSNNNMLCSCVNTDLLILIVIGYVVYRYMNK